MTKRRLTWANLDDLILCPLCGRPWKWVRVEAQGGGDPNAPVTERFDAAECVHCGVRVEVDQPLEDDNEKE